MRPENKDVGHKFDLNIYGMLLIKKFDAAFVRALGNEHVRYPLDVVYIAEWVLESMRDNF